MKHQATRLAQRPFARNVAALAGGTAATQAIAVAFAPLVTRLYGPAAYGAQGVFMALVAVGSTVAALSYPMAIVLPRSDEDAYGLVRLSMYVGLITAVVAAAILPLVSRDAFSVIRAEQIASLKHLLPFAMFSSVVAAVAAQWGIRRQAFLLIAQTSVISAVLSGAVKVALGLVAPTASALIVVNVLGGLIGATLLALSLRRTGFGTRAATRASLRPGAWRMAAAHRDFALLRTPQTFVNAVSQSLPILMLASCYGSSAVGFYSIASTVLAVPANLIGGSVMQVFYPRITEAIHRGEDAAALIVRATRALALTGAPLLAMIVLAGPGVFNLLFGSGWRTAGVYAQWLSVWLYMQYINRPAVSAIPALRLQGGLLVYELFSTASKVGALYVGHKAFGSDVAAIALFSVSGSLAYAWLIAWVVSTSRQKARLALASR